MLSDKLAGTLWHSAECNNYSGNDNLQFDSIGFMAHKLKIKTIMFEPLAKYQAIERQGVFLITY